MSADELYEQQYYEVLHELDVIKQELQQHRAFQKHNPDNWSFVADLNGMIIELHTISTDFRTVH